ncbi:acyltransferase [Lactococcus piscium]|uniref:acyltransferase family protein n=1 Tax=Pseudolactococcus carnosus TaxID=2749961 RepID=UPI001FBAA538|nr:acyltransferase [Lactococcus carnosus]MCJ1996247.1 acyltransferase [Lactococcus carnosus]
MIKKERVYALDFIRAIAVILILITHYNSNFIGFNGPAQPEKVIITAFPFNIYIGDLGVGLFLLISGASMYYVYANQKICLSKFIKKRLLNILPMFYISYVLAFMYNFWVNKGFSHDNMSLKWGISTIFGFDSMMQTAGFPSFMLVGEWFLGMIMIVYTVFPLLKLCFEKQTWVTIVVSIFTFVSIQSIQYEGNHFWVLIQLTIGLVPVVIFGMTLQKYTEVLKKFVSLIVSILVLFVISFGDFSVLPSKIRMAIISISFFVILTHLAKYFEKNIIKKGVKWLVKYAYPIFLVHHFIINQVVKHFDLMTIGRLDSYILFSICLSIIFPISVLVFRIERVLVDVK